MNVSLSQGRVLVLRKWRSPGSRITHTIFSLSEMLPLNVSPSTHRTRSKQTFKMWNILYVRANSCFAVKQLLNCFPHIRYFQNSLVEESMKEPTHIFIQIRLILYLNFLTRANEYSQCCRPLFLVSICTRKSDFLILYTHVALFTGTIIACFSIFCVLLPSTFFLQKLRSLKSWTFLDYKNRNFTPRNKSFYSQKRAYSRCSLMFRFEWINGSLFYWQLSVIDESFLLKFKNAYLNNLILFLFMRCLL